MDLPRNLFGGAQWIQPAQDSDRWRTVVKAPMNIRGPIKCAQFTGHLRNCQLLKASAAVLKPLNAELNSICHLLALLGAHHILYVSRIRVN